MQAVVVVLPGIEVDDVRNPHCSDCGRPILSSDLPLVVRYKSPVKQTQEWEKRFDAKFVMEKGVEGKGKRGRGGGRGPGNRRNKRLYRLPEKGNGREDKSCGKTRT